MGDLPLHARSYVAGDEGISIFSALSVEHQEVPAFQVDVFCRSERASLTLGP